MFSIKKFIPVAASVFFFALHYASVLYVNSTLLTNFFSTTEASLLFVGGALGGILLFLFGPEILNSLGRKRFYYIVSITSLISVGSLAFLSSRLSIAIAFLIYISASFIIVYLLDIFLEEISEDGKTGEIRGIYLTILNSGIILGPLLVALLITQDNLSPIYLLSAMALVPVLIVGMKLEDGEPGGHEPHQLPWREWWLSGDIKRVTIARFILEFFFSFMTIYASLYLVREIGFEWSVIGIMFTIMLIPFVLFQWPVGELADRFFGEKEFMVTGFILMFLAVIMIPYLPASVAIWTGVLLASRVGASLVEVTTDSYFFKHVSSHDTKLISFFRITRPLSVAVASLVGIISLQFLSFSNIFLVLGFFILLGLKEAIAITDTK